MIELSLQEAATAMDGELIGGNRDFSGVSTDTRALKSGQIFFALKGEKFDGHEMCDEAERLGAVASVVDHQQQLSGAQLVVADTRLGLGSLSNYWRRKHKLRVVGVTGSNGKTTVKEMIASILARCATVLATRGNFNNDIGLPKTLFELGPEHEFAVLEMGANHIGEIAQLAAIAEPDVAIVTLCAPAHLEGFGSIEGVAQAKGEIYSHLRENGIAIINADDDFSDYWRQVAANRRIITFAIENQADVTASNIRSNGLGYGMSFNLNLQGQHIEANIPHDGIHNVMNALAASAAAISLGCSLSDILAGLEHCDIVSGRLNIHQVDAYTKLIDDTYNANPTSLIAAARVAVTSGDDTWVVLGDMAELGADSRKLHVRCGRELSSLGVTKLFTYGRLANAASDEFEGPSEDFANKDELTAGLLQQLAQHGDSALIILVKGSRSMQMETVVRDLMQHGEKVC